MFKILVHRHINIESFYFHLLLTLYALRLMINSQKKTHKKEFMTRQYHPYMYGMYVYTYIVYIHFIQFYSILFYLVIRKHRRLKLEVRSRERGRGRERIEIIICQSFKSVNFGAQKVYKFKWVSSLSFRFAALCFAPPSLLPLSSISLYLNKVSLLFKLN